MFSILLQKLPFLLYNQALLLTNLFIQQTNKLKFLHSLLESSDYYLYKWTPSWKEQFIQSASQSIAIYPSYSLLKLFLHQPNSMAYVQISSFQMVSLSFKDVNYFLSEILSESDFSAFWSQDFPILFVLVTHSFNSKLLESFSKQSYMASVVTL